MKMVMRLAKTTVLVTGIAGGWMRTLAFAADDGGVNAAADLSVLSAYVWRGQVLNDKAVLQPATAMTVGGFVLNIWGNFNLTDAATGDEREFSEVDLTLSYSRTVGPVTLGGGLIEYLFPNQTLLTMDGTVEAYPETSEVYLGASLPGLPLAPSLTVYYDFREAQSFYVSGALAYMARLVEHLNLGLNASLGYAAAKYNAFYFGVDNAALNDANFGLSLTWSPWPRVTLTPAYQYTMLVDADIEDAAASLYKDQQRSIFSCKATYTF